MKDIVCQIGEQEIKHNAGSSEQIGAKLRVLRDRLNLTKAKSDLARCRKISYEFGNKPGKRLARTLRLHRDSP